MFLVVLGFTVLMFFFYFIWLVYGNDMQKLSAYATFLTGLATASLALVTLYMARATKGMVEDMTRSRKQVYMTELVALAVDPLIERTRERRRSLNERRFDWGQWPKEDRADKVLNDEKLRVFSVPVVNDPNKFMYFVPYPDLAIMDIVALSSSGFEFKRALDLETRYKSLTEKVKSFDTLSANLPQFLGKLVWRVHTCLNELTLYKNLEAALCPSVVCIVFHKLILSQEDFDYFMHNFTGYQSPRAKDFYIQNSSVIEPVVLSQLNGLRGELDSQCANLDKTLQDIEKDLEQVRLKLCQEFFISEGAVKQVRNSINRLIF